MEGIKVQYFLTCHEVEQDEDDNANFYKVFEKFFIEESPSKITFSVVVGVHHNNQDLKTLQLIIGELEFSVEVRGERI